MNDNDGDLTQRWLMFSYALMVVARPPRFSPTIENNNIIILPDSRCRCAPSQIFPPIGLRMEIKM